ncbi:MAG: hypothetical protein HDS39_06080 [Bacteroides sp.]|nr:hypothetical protein [Bacteroides sp.]
MPTKLAAYPYPVLSELDDFQHPLPEDAAQYYIDSDRNNYIIQIDLKVENKDILELISGNKAEYFVQIDCPTTSMRVCWRFTQNTFQITVPRTEILNKVEVSCSVIATGDIKGYSCSDFNKTYYEGKNFDLEKGDVMVIFRSYIFDTRIKMQKDARLGDYIEFREGNGVAVTFDLDEIIYITIPKKLYNQYQAIKPLLDLNSAIIHSSFVMGALMYGLSEIGSNPGKVWAKSITAKLLSDSMFKEGIHYKLEDDGKISHVPNPMEVASMILEDPYARMIENMKNYQLLSEENNG